MCVTIHTASRMALSVTFVEPSTGRPLASRYFWYHDERLYSLRISSGTGATARIWGVADSCGGVAPPAENKPSAKRRPQRCWDALFLPLPARNEWGEDRGEGLSEKRTS